MTYNDLTCNIKKENKLVTIAKRVTSHTIDSIGLVIHFNGIFGFPGLDSISFTGTELRTILGAIPSGFYSYSQDKTTA